MLVYSCRFFPTWYFFSKFFCFPLIYFKIETLCKCNCQVTFTLLTYFIFQLNADKSPFQRTYANQVSWGFHYAIIAHFLASSAQNVFLRPLFILICVAYLNWSDYWWNISHFIFHHNCATAVILFDCLYVLKTLYELKISILTPPWLIVSLYLPVCLSVVVGPFCSMSCIIWLATCPSCNYLSIKP